MPATSPPETSINSVFQPRSSHQRRYMRKSISAQSCACATGSCLDVDERVARIVRARKHALEFKLGDARLQPAQVLGHGKGGVVIGVGHGKLQQFLGVAEAMGQRVD